MHRLSSRDRLQAAADAVATMRQRHVDAAAIIATLQRDHGASYRCNPSTNTLRVAGVNASCTWSSTDGLLKAWVGRATIRLMQLDGRAAA